jgi:hypothetical protein
MQIRLAGIDAPEVAHSNEAIGGLRYEQEQPFGETGRAVLDSILRSSPDAQILVDPTQDTYGRSLGVLMAGGKNINLELVRQGAAAQLPFGEVSSDLIPRSQLAAAEMQAYSNKQGMWSSEYWQAYHRSVSNDARVTFNTLTRIDKMADNMNLAALNSTMQIAQNGGSGTEPFVSQSINYLKPKLAALAKPSRDYSPSSFPQHYNIKMDYMDQLKVETQRHMSHYGNQISDIAMATKDNLRNNQHMAIDSLTPSTSIYRSSLPVVLDDYQIKARRKRLRGEMQRTVNGSMFMKKDSSMRI